MKIRRTEDWESIKALHTLIFVGDEWEESDAGWILWDDHGAPVGFCTARLLTFESGVYLTRAGLLPGVRGKGIQRRMVYVRENWARGEGRDFAITYASLDNYASIANLLRCGYKFHTPQDMWAGKDVHYFLKEFKNQSDPSKSER